ncbi:MAG: thiamine-phosphate pyrophosphorylase [Flavipsychrobacter sp.]|nr:thiamine-phosphate pyrophosphorylase [Flavipsychrobacter sp.]
MRTISKLQYITTSARLAEQACIGGVDWIQLRLKDIPYADYYSIASDVQAVCKEFNATFIINDNAALALDINADGVHLGRKDMSPEIARALIGNSFIIGATANTIEDITRLSAMPIDYIGLGPYRFTSTKQNLAPILGIDGYKQIFARLDEQGVTPPPIIGIGGVTKSDVAHLLATGLYGVAVSGAISNAADVTKAAIELKRTFDYEVQ